MSWSKDAKIGTRLAIGFGSIVFILMAIILTLTFLLKGIEENSSHVEGESLVFALVADDMAKEVLQVQQLLTDVAVTHKAEGYKEAEKSIGVFKEGCQKFRKMYNDEKDTKSLKELEEMEKLFMKFSESGRKMASTYIDQGREEGNKAMEEFDRLALPLREKVENFRQQQNNEATEKMQGIVQSVGYALFLLFIMGGIAIVLAVVIAVSISRSVTRPIGTAVEISKKLAQGDLTMEIKTEAADETGMMLKAMKDMVEELKRIVYQTIDASNQVAASADQVSEANQNFSARISEQAASVEETSATVEEMAASIKHTAINAETASSLAKEARGSAEAGSSVMSDTILAMDEINRSSGKIASISNVIEEIAFQTNLLALNAAVEAARAGEHGKGFAVVASEIRDLAQRTKQSAKEITELIADSSDKTGKGVRLAQELSKKLEEIGLSVRKVTDLMDEVAAASQEQSSGINQVNIAMTQIDQTVQHNASLVEETASAAEELAALSRQLLKLVSFFNLGSEGVVSEKPKPKKLAHSAPIVPAAAKPKAGIITHQPAPKPRINLSDTSSSLPSSPKDKYQGFEEF